MTNPILPMTWTEKAATLEEGLARAATVARDTNQNVYVSVGTQGTVWVSNKFPKYAPEGYTVVHADGSVDATKRRPQK